MIRSMPTRRRPQQRYDHRLRNLVQRTGDVTVATDLGVPRSTARGWLAATPTVVVCLDVGDLPEPELRQEVLKLRRRVQKLTALLRLALALLRTSECRLTGVRLPDEGEIKRAKAILAAAKKPVLTGLPEVYARETVLMAKFPPKVNVILQALRVGELGIVANPCETFVEIGLEIKKESPLKQTFTIELANGYNGYLPTPEHHELGGYETWRARSSYLEVNASNAIIATWLELLKEVAK